MHSIKFREHFWWVKRYIKDMIKKGNDVIYLIDRKYDEYAL